MPFAPQDALLHLIHQPGANFLRHYGNLLGHHVSDYSACVCQTCSHHYRECVRALAGGRSVLNLGTRGFLLQVPGDEPEPEELHQHLLTYRALPLLLESPP